MTQRIDVDLGDSAIPYVAALDGALRAVGLWDGQPWMLAGLTGLGFHLVVDPKTCPASPTAYFWKGVHSAAAERLGIESTAIECVGKAEEYPARRDQAVALIKESLDSGRPAVVRTVDWAEFAIVAGYDDDDRVFFFDDRHADPVLYANLGSPHGFPFLFAQTFGERRPFDLPAAAKSSLAYAVTCWRGDGFQKHKWYDFAVGAQGYAALIRAVDSGETDPLGLRYIIKIHADSRRSVAQYVRALAEEKVVPGIEPVAAAYEQVAPLAERVAELLPSVAPFERAIDSKAAAEASPLLRDAAVLEESAVTAIENTVLSAMR